MGRAAVLVSLLGLTASAGEPAQTEAAVAPWLVAAPSAPDPLVFLPAEPERPQARPVLLDVDSPRPAPELPGEELNLGWTLVRTLVVLGIVIMAIYLTLNFGLRRLMGLANVPRGQAVVQVVERIPLDQKRAMFVVKAAGEFLLIGGGDGALQLIAKLDAAEVEKLRQQPAPGIAVSPFLLKLLKRRDVPVPPAPGDNS